MGAGENMYYIKKENERLKDFESRVQNKSFNEGKEYFKARDFKKLTFRRFKDSMKDGLMSESNLKELANELGIPVEDIKGDLRPKKKRARQHQNPQQMEMIFVEKTEITSKTLKEMSKEMSDHELLHALGPQRVRDIYHLLNYEEGKGLL